jgi:hypothetical protein
VVPFEVNCCFAPSTTLVLMGEMVVGALSISVTCALAEPPGPFAVTVAEPEDGQVAGAV